MNLMKNIKNIQILTVTMGYVNLRNKTLTLRIFETNDDSFKLDQSHKLEIYINCH